MKFLYFYLQILPLRIIVVLLFVFLQTNFSYCQQPYWQQKVDYNIAVTLNDKEHTLDGFEKIFYTNNSPDTLHFIWFHIWPNAYKNDKTAFTEQMLGNNSTRFYFSEKEQRGYINRLDFKVNNVTAKVEDHPHHIDIIKVMLPQPLLPGSDVSITTPFHVKLPEVYSRGGHSGQTYHITQWYPKPAVYDKEGWHPMPYLDQGEFYSEFGHYQVEINVPENYIVAATGELQNPAELNKLKQLSQSLKTELISPDDKKTDVRGAIPSSPTMKSLIYSQDKVHDFAWFASKEFNVLHDTLKLESGRIVDVFSYFFKRHYQNWKHSTDYIKNAVRTRSAWVGEYPYNVVSVVEDEVSGGGMEYPTITLVSHDENARMLEYIIAHEVSHNWFQGILGSNERRYPWLDEGLNTYYDNRYSKEKYADVGEMKMGARSVSLTAGERLMFETIAAVNRDQAINTHAEQFTNINYNMVAYYKTGAWLEYLERELGKETFDKAMQEYYRRWQFKHPSPADLQKTFEDVSGRKLDAQFALLNTKGILPGMERKGVKFITPFSINAIIDHVNNPSKELFIVSPAVGFNSYDKFMLGGALSNYKLPPSKLQFVAVPLYAFGSKQLNFIGNVNYSMFSQGLVHRADLFVNASMFSMDEFMKDDGEKVLFGFKKFVPGARVVFRNKDARSKSQTSLELKSFIINEESYRIRYDSVITPIDTTITQIVSTLDNRRTLHQLKLTVDNLRVLYPYSGELNIEHGTDFIRAAFTGNYFFNYKKAGGLNVRLFAGKFFYLSPKTFSKQFATDRYHLNMTGANGYEDYTYSDYFVGRNKFDGLASQQIMMRDGGFKVRTDLYAEKVGKTDDWLAAVNFTTSVPDAINPLTMLPVKIPLRAFVDIGTYSQAWDRESELDRFVFDAGLQLSLIRGSINIYFPLVYSRIYKDYIQSVLEKKGRMWKKVSFSIDLSKFSLRKVTRQLSL